MADSAPATAPAAQPTAPAGVVTMYDRSGNAVAVPEEQAADAYRTGQLGFAEGQQVVLRRGRDVVALDGGQAGNLLDSGEGKYYSGGTGQEFAEQEEARELGGFGGQAKAFGAGLARAVTLGGSDWLASEVGGEDARHSLAALQRVNPGASLLGEGAGLVLPAALSGGSALAARAGIGAAARGGTGILGRLALGGLEATTAPVRAVSAIGRGLEGVVVRGLGEGMVGRALGAGLAGAAEGAAYGTGQEVSRAALHNEDLAAERLVAAGIHGALLGGGVGAGLSVAGTVARGVANKAADVGASIAGLKPGGGVRGLVEQGAERQALKAAGADEAAVAQLQAIGPGAEQRAARKYLSEMPEAMGQKPGTVLASPEAKAQGAAKLLERDTAKLDATLGELSTGGVKVDASKAIGDVRSKLLSDLAGGAGTTEAKLTAQRGERWLAGVERDLADGDLRTLWAKREALAAEGATLPRGVTPGLRHDVVAALDREIVDAGAKAEGKLGAEAATRYREALADVQVSKWLKQTTEAAAGAGTKNFGPLDALKASVGAATSGGGVGGALMAPVASYAGHLAKRYGPDVLAHVGHAAARGELAQVVDRLVEHAVGERVAAIVRGTAEGLAKARPLTPAVIREAARRNQNEVDRKEREQAFRQRKAALDTYLANPPAALAHAAVPALAAHPQVQAKAATVMKRGADFLASKMPQTPQRQTTLTPRADKLPPRAQQEKFLRYAAAVDNPLGVLDAAHHGRISPEGAEVLREVYPEMHKQLIDSVQEQLRERKAKGEPPLPRAVAIRLTTLTGVPADDTLTPDVMATIQAAYSSVSVATKLGNGLSGGGGGRGDGGPRRPPNLDTAAMAPRTDRIGALG